MMIASAVTIVSICVALLEVPSLRRKQLRKELWIFSVLLVFGTILGIARSLHIPIWNPTDLIMFTFKPVSDFLIGLFKS